MVDAVNGDFLGFGLNVSQRLAVRTALSKLRINENNPNITFWGKISGTTTDYLIAQGTVSTESIKKSYYFSCDNGVTFAKMSVMDDFIKEKVGTVSGLFTGNPAKLYKDPNAPAEEEEEPPEEDEGDEKKEDDPSKRKLNELERLSYTVEAIDNDTCVQARGAYVLTPVGQIQKNRSFAGLTATECKKLDNFLLFRDPQNSQTLARIRKLGVSNNPDFLDPIMEGQPSGVWVCQVDDACTQARLRSLVWPGYEFKLQVESQNSVGAYFGNGMKNEDVMFML